MAKLEIPEWTGSALTHAAFTNFASGVLGVFMQQTFAKLALDEIGPDLTQAVRRLADFVNRQRKFDATEAVAAADAKRDALWKALWNAWHYIMQLPADDSLHQAAAKLTSEMNAYKGVYRHEISKETTELKGLQRDLSSSDNTFAIQVLGLSTIVNALFAANDEVAAAVEARLAERGDRIEDKSGDSTPEIRKAVVNLLVEAFRQVNAVNRVSHSEETAAAVKAVNALIEQYKLVASQPKSRQKEVDPTPPDEGGDSQPDVEASAS